MKTCANCRQTKRFTDFHKSKDRKDGHNPYCKACCLQYRFENRETLRLKKKEYYQIPQIKEYTRTYRARYYKENKEQMLVQQRDYYALPENRAKKLLSKTKERATKDGIPFNLELEDIVIPTHCPYLGMKLTHHLGQGYLDSNSSIDKIVPELGYTKGNVQVISRLANQMKNSATKEQLLTFAHNIIKLYS
jgi:hypothetical protein